MPDLQGRAVVPEKPDFRSAEFIAVLPIQPPIHSTERHPHAMFLTNPVAAIFQGDSKMTWKNLLPACAGVLLLSVVGCTSPLSQLIRGQSPDGGCNSCPGGQSGAIVYGDGCQQIQGGGHFWGSGRPHGNGWQATGPFHNEYESQHHTHHWDYIPPYGLSYPPDGQPNAVVFYPYYTLKGPDDFFYGMNNR
jgi:hypothetical protein